MADTTPSVDNVVEYDEPEKGRRETLQAEAEEWVEEARHQKAEWERDLRELYFFASPHRARQISSRTPNSTKPQDAGESNTSFACEMSGDFATVIMNTFMPEMNPWASREPGLSVPEAVAEAVKDKIAAEDAKIFKLISASNFYAECSTCFIPDLSAGTVAMWIDDPRPYAGVECQAIPLHELEICIGPTGHLDFRAFVQHVKFHKLKAFLPRIKDWPKEIEDDCANKDKRKEKVEVRRCFWRDWTVTNDVAWQHVVMVGKHLVFEKTIRGEGSCAMIVARFGAVKEWAFAPGPGIQSLPDYRALDELAAAKIMNCDISLRPPITIPDDSIVNFEEGVEAGFAYPIRVGSEDAVKNIYNATSPDVAIYDRNDTEQRIKRLHFLDFPDQLGKTPPSATQWLDQMTMAQRRIGTPGAAFWNEWCREVFMRYEYLGSKRGFVTAVKHNGKQVSLTPQNPARKAADQQEVAQATRVIQIAAEAWPEEWKLAVDGTQTIKNITEKSGADKIIAFRPADQVQSAVKMIAQLQQGTPGSAPAAAANAGQPAAPAPVGPPPAPPTATQIRGKL